ncbi:MAG: PepSY domain-containing protein [Pelistega sp.]|nr:PepSY domain-containing protein [Pelistega sp.]
MKRLFTMSAVATGIVFGSMGGAAYADDDGRHRARAAISKERAVSIAERQVKGGRATDVDFERDDGRSYYEIDVRGSNKRIYEIKVDANSGKVISSKVDDDDDDDDRRKSRSYAKDDDDDDRRKSRKSSRDDDDDDDD